jgi:hypothetical protein
MSSLEDLGLRSTLRREGNIFRLVGMLKRQAHVQEVLKSLSVKPNTIYSYLLVILEAQFEEPRYLKYLEKVEVKDSFQREELNSWIVRAKKYEVTGVKSPYFQEYNEKFYEELHYFLWVFKCLK